jgi:hypothetical protein
VRHVQKASMLYIPRMVDQVQHFDVCSVVNNRQTGAMSLLVRTRTNKQCVRQLTWILRRWRDYAFPSCSPMESLAKLKQVKVV